MSLNHNDCEHAIESSDDSKVSNTLFESSWFSFYLEALSTTRVVEVSEKLTELNATRP